MWLELDNSDNIIYHLESPERLPDNVDMVDDVVIHAYNKNICDVLTTLMSIVTRRVRVTLETSLPWRELTPLIRKYIDEYINVYDNTHKVKTEVFNDVFDE